LSYSVIIEPDSKFGEFHNTEEICVNFFHHQSIKEFGKGLASFTNANDGIIEAFESTIDHFFRYGVAPRIY